MLSYRTPGVYFQYADPPRVLPGLRADIAGFVGIARRGPLHNPKKIESWTQFLSTFGSQTPQGYLAYAVYGFFANGGRECWVVRVADPDTAKPGLLTIANDASSSRVQLQATSPGVWSNALQARLQRVNTDTYNLTLRLRGRTDEFWPRIGLDEKHVRFIGKVLPDSQLARVSPQLDGSALMTVRIQAPVAQAYFAGGTDGLATLRLNHLSGEGAPAGVRWGLACLEGVDEVSIVAMPDAMSVARDETHPTQRHGPNCNADADESYSPPVENGDPEYAPELHEDEVRELQFAQIAHCERLRDRFAVLDARLGQTAEAVQQWRERYDTSYAALYYPWVCVYAPAEAGLAARVRLRTVPPCGHVAGVFARLAITPGVHKPPANEVLEDVRDVESQVDDLAHAVLNENSINAIRLFNGPQVRVAGARTLSSDVNLRYINVRRLLSMMAEAIDEGTQWTVFEPGNPELWSEIERVVRQYLNGLWQRGMLDGTTADEAFGVMCNTTTNPPEETELGRVICRVEVHPPWPAEFVVVRIGKTESNTEILEVSSDGRDRSA